MTMPRTEESILSAARRIEDPDARRQFLQQACADNAALRAQVETLLGTPDAEQSFLQPAPPPPAPAVSAPAIGERPGAMIGPYKLLQQIGEGGMGTVWMAEQQQPVRRKVALKVIRPGIDNRHLLARFEAERQALALMDHPNIAKVLDAGVTDGRPYFVMELIKGTPITKYCDEHRLPLRQRLGLFVPVCQAVQHAHTKGVIHRDLKPSNVLIAPYDGKLVPKVIDFGVAKAAGQVLTERTLYTEFGAVVGTLEYMSPEQAELNNQDIDTRSDVYSLGVLLYELLTGTTPLERKKLKDGSMLEVLRIIREEEPPRPSARLSTTEHLPAVASKRGLEARQLRGVVRGELDWIVMKALEKDRNRRYETANGLGRDVERYLNNDPVQACPPSVRYRIRKFLNRNKGPVLAAALLVVALLAGVAASTWQMQRARQAERDAVAGWEGAERQERAAVEARNKADAARAGAVRAEADARRSADKARAVNSFLFNNLLMKSTGWYDRGEQVQFAKLLRASSDNLDGAFARQPEIECMLRLKIGNALAGAGMHAEAEPHLRRGLALYAAGTGADGRAEEEAEAHFARKHLGEYLRSRGQFPEAEALLRRYEEARRRLEIRHIPYTVNVHVLCAAFSPDGRRVLAGGDGHDLRLFDVATGTELHRFPAPAGGGCVTFSADGRRALSGDGPGAVRLWDVEKARQVRQFTGHTGCVNSVAFSPDGRRALSASHDKTVRMWDVETGKEIHRFEGHTAAVRNAVFSPDGRQVLSGSRDRSIRLWDAETGKEVRQLRGTGADAEWGWCVAYSPDGRHAAAIHERDVGLLLWDVETGEEVRGFPGSVGGDWVVFTPDGRGLLTNHHMARKMQLWEVATGKLLKVFSQEAPARPNTPAISADGRMVVCGTWRGAVVLWRLAAAPPAMRRLREARACWEAKREDPGREHPEALAALDDLAALLWEQGRRAEAEGLYREGLEARRRGLGPDHPETLFALRILASLLQGDNKAAAAEPLWRQYLEGCRRVFGAGHGDTAVAQETLLGLLHSRALRLLARGQFVEAERRFREVYDTLRATLPADHPRIVHALSEWAISLEDKGEFARAIPLIRELLKHKQRPPPSPPKKIDLRTAFRDLLAGKRAPPPASADAAGVQAMLGWALTETGQAKEAEPVLREALRGCRGTWGPGHWVTANAESLLGGCLSAQGRYAEAEPPLRRGYNGLVRAWDTPPVRRRQALGRIIHLYDGWENPFLHYADKRDELRQVIGFYRDWGQPAQAVALAKKAVDAAPQKGTSLEALGIAHYRAGEFGAAAAALEKALPQLGGGDGLTWFVLAMACGQKGDSESARRWYDRGRQWLAENAPGNAEGLALRTEASEVLRRPRLAVLRVIPYRMPWWPHTVNVIGVDVSRDGRLVLACGDVPDVRLVDADTGNPLLHFHGHKHWVYVVALSPDGKRALSGGTDKTLRLWDVTSGKELRQLLGHTTAINFVTFSPDGRRALSGGFGDRADLAIHMWDVKTGKEIRQLRGHTDRIHQAVFSPDGRQVLSASSDRTIRLWDVETGNQIRQFQDPGVSGTVCFSPDGKKALSIRLGDVALRLWDVETGKLLRRLEGFGDKREPPSAVVFTADGRRAVSAHHFEGRLRLWDVGTGRELYSIQPDRSLRINRLAISADGRRLACGNWRGSVVVVGLPDADRSP
jgi:WD40 repeat protein/serine/threonine protein kinase